MKKMLLLATLITLLVPFAAQAQALFPIEVGHKWGYIDSTGKIVIEPQYALACAFNEGVAWVVPKAINDLNFDENVMNAFETMEYEFTRDGTGYTWSLIDPHGTILATTERSKLKPLVYNGVTPIFDGDYFRGGWGTIDTKGTIIIKGSYISIGFMNDDRLKTSMADFGPYRFVEPNGKVIGRGDFQQAESFSDGAAAVYDADKQKWGFIDPAGKWQIAPRYTSVGKFYEGLACVTTDSMYGYIDHTGTLVIRQQFNDADRFSEGLARVTLGENYGYIDRSGTMVIPATLTIPAPKDAFAPSMHSYAFREGRALFQRNELFGYLDATGKEIIAPQFADAYTFEHGVARVKKDGKWCYIDRNGNVIWQHA